MAPQEGEEGVALLVSEFDGKGLGSAQGRLRWETGDENRSLFRWDYIDESIRPSCNRAFVQQCHGDPEQGAEGKERGRPRQGPGVIQTQRCRPAGPTLKARMRLGSTVGKAATHRMTVASQAT
jgi:hypothetical protein